MTSALEYTTPYGKLDYEPTVISTIEVDDTPLPQAIHTEVITFLGRSFFGKPLLSDGSGIMSFTRPGVAENVLGVCPSTALMRMMWDPSPDPVIQGANEIAFLRLGTIAQSTLSLLNSSTGVLVATSVQSGLDSTKAAIRIVGSGATRDVYTSFKGGRVVSYLALGRALKMQYVGSGSAATLTITRNASDEAITLTTACTGATADNLSIDLRDFKTLAGLASFINAYRVTTSAVYTCTVDPSADGTMPVKYLDPYGTESVSALNILTLAQVDAKLGAIVWRTRTDPYLIITRVAAAILPPTAIGWTHLAGGTGSIDDTVNAAGVQTALDYLDAQDRKGGIIFVESTDIDVQLTVQAWIELQRTEQSKRWRLWTAVLQTSSGTATTDDARIAQGQSLNYVHTRCAGIGTNGLNYLREEETSTLFFAARLAGMNAGYGLVEPLTRKRVRVTRINPGSEGTEKKLSKAQRNRYIQAGLITPIWMDQPDGGWLVNMAVTTDTSDSKRPNTLVSERDLIDKIDDMITAQLTSKFLGKWADPTVVAAMRAVVFDILSFWETAGKLTVNPDDPGSKAFLIGTISVSAGVAQIPWNGWFGGEINHIEPKGKMAYQKIQSTASADLQRRAA